MRVQLGKTLVDHASSLDAEALPARYGRTVKIAELLAQAAARIRRYEPAEARAAAERGAIVVDIRAADTRERDGVIPGSLHVPRTVLEWRADPTSEWRNPALAGVALILVCDHGYSSVLAAATLVDLGVDAGDVVGGFEAWAAAGLPVGRPLARKDGQPGMDAPG
jgi:rhodanese-related sulfurtransferase